MVGEPLRLLRLRASAQPIEPADVRTRNPSKTIASARIRHAAATSLMRRAFRRSPAASKSNRVIWIAVPMMTYANRARRKRNTSVARRESPESQMPAPDA
jgi:hypothetical protein